MDSQWLEPSPQAVMLKDEHQFKPRYNFPFAEVPLHMSFKVARDEVKNLNVLRTIATRAGAKVNRKFKVVDHGDAGYEVFYAGPRDVSSI